MVDDVKNKIEINVKANGLDEAIEKASRLIELLREAQNIASSLSGSQSNQSDYVFDLDSFSSKMYREIQSRMKYQDKTEEYQNAIDCATQHIRTFLAQGTNRVVADLGEVCTCCPLRKNGRCTEFDWLKKLDPILNQSTVKLSVCDAGKANYE